VLISTAGIPAVGVTLIMGVDRILNMSHAVINVSGTLTVAKLIDHRVGPKTSLKDELHDQEKHEDIRK
jgi:Na+/H+-dicarboxylate symporter